MNTKQIRPHFIRSTHKQKLVYKEKNGTKLLLFAMKRMFAKTMQQSLIAIEKYSEDKNEKLTKLKHILQKNQYRARVDSWKKIREYVLQKKKNIRTIKRIFIISNRCSTVSLQKAFVKLLVFSKNKEKTFVKGLFERRNSILQKKICRFYKNRLGQAFTKLKETFFTSKIQYQKVRYLSGIIKNLKEKKQRLFLEALKYQNESCQTGKQIRDERQSKIQSLEKEIKIKDSKYQELQTKLMRKNSKNHNNLLHDGNENYKKRSLSQASMKGSMILKSIEKEKSELGSRGDLSIGSILNGSFLSFKSRQSSHDSMEGDCFCKYRQKYNHYKCETISLKNQMQILKKELQVTKDLNQHLQGQITAYFVDPNQNQEAQRLAKEVKQLKKQRESMKQKILKYQKYIANLKFEFKTKMESLYRNVKKSAH